MATVPDPQVAIRGLERSLEYAKCQTESVSSLYNPGVANLQEIRELASQVMMLANQALSRIGLDDPKYIVKAQSQEIDVAKIAAEASSQAVVNILTQFNLIGQQNMQVEQLIQYNQVQEQGVHAEDKAQDVEVGIEPPQNSGNSSKFRRIAGNSENCAKGFVKSTENSLKSGKKPGSLSKNFKEILKSTSNLPDSAFCDSRTQTCAKICSEYFKTRFDKRNDPNSIHKFSQNSFRDYLGSIVLAYSESCTEGLEDEFKNEVRTWLNAVKHGAISDTLPSSCNSIFFDVFQEKAKDFSREFSQNTIDLANSIWEELWDLGFHEFESLDSEFQPTHKFDWVDMSVHATNRDDTLYSGRSDAAGPCDILLSGQSLNLGFIDDSLQSNKAFTDHYNQIYRQFQSETELELSEEEHKAARAVGMKWVKLEQDCTSYKTLKRIARKASISISEAIPRGYCNLSSGILIKSLMFYIASNPSRIERLLREIDELCELCQIFDDSCAKDKCSAEVVLQNIRDEGFDIKDSELDMIFVLETYVKHYSEVVNGCS